MPYRRPDTDQLMADLTTLTGELQSAASAEEAFQIYKRYEELTVDYSTMATICNIRNTVDTRDEFYERERGFFDEMGPVLSEKIQDFERALVECRFRPELEQKLGSLLFKNKEMALRSFSPDIVTLMQEENALRAEYQKLYASAQVEFAGRTCTIAQLGLYKQDPDRALREAAYRAEGSFFDEHQAEFDDIYDRLVKNRTAQAKKLGMENYVELGYLRQQRNCYGPKEVANFRRQVIEDLVPIVCSVKENRARRIGVDALRFYDDVYAFPDGNAVPQGTPDELLAAGRRMYTEMSPETADFIKLMFDMDLFDVLAKDGKAPGGYCTHLEAYHAPFIFSNFNGTSGDVDVLTHEAGHAFAAYVADHEIERMELREPTMEAAETHSMSMEFLTSPWHELFFKGQTPKYELSHAEDALIFIPYGTEVDHFQEIVYSNPEMTPAERNAAWMEIDRQYRPYIDYADLPFYARGAGWQRQLHIYLYPFYYLEYCMAQTVALQFWVAFMKDSKAAWEKYLAFVRMGGTKTFTDLVKTVGLVSPLEDGSLKSIAGPVEKWLAEHQI